MENHSTITIMLMRYKMDARGDQRTYLRTLQVDVFMDSLLSPSGLSQELFGLCGGWGSGNLSEN